MSEPDNTEVEIELTYLARELPKELAGVKPKQVLDVYVPEGSSDPELRLRKKGDKYEITKKTPITEGDFSQQLERTIPLSSDEFNALKNSSVLRVEKDRYNVLLDGNAAEVDVFQGALAGLVLIDFEFSSLEERAAFTPPSCCLADVTQEHFIAGGRLAGRSYADIAENLARYEYQKLQV